MGSLQPDHTGREFLRAVIRPKPSNGAGFSRKVIVFGEVSDACSARRKTSVPAEAPWTPRTQHWSGFQRHGKKSVTP